MQFMVHSPPRDPVQTYLPQFIPQFDSNVSPCRSPIRPQYRRAYCDKTQRSVDQSYRPKVDINKPANASRKRSRIEVKDGSLKLPIDQKLCHDRGQVDNKTEMNFNDILPSSIGSATHKDELDTSISSYEIPRKAPRVSSAASGDGIKSSFDEFSWRLGVGWSSVLDSDPDVQAAVRGWANFIENHFPVNNANIRLRNDGLGCFLVEAKEGYYLFGDDLKQGKLVSTNLENVWTNLQGPVPVFEGETLVRAAERTTNFSQIDLKNSNTWPSKNINSSSIDHALIQNQCVNLADSNIEVQMRIF